MQKVIIMQDDSSIKRIQLINLLNINGISDPTVLQAMQKVERHLFVPEQYKEDAYNDCALPIECNQTISQPYIVAFMTEAANLDADSKVLEIGTGSGYQAAILGEICKEVYSIEVIKKLAESASSLLEKLGYKNIHVKHDNGKTGWQKHAPFDTIIITAAATKIPDLLLKQLHIDGNVIFPLEDKRGHQTLVRLTKTSTNNDYSIEHLLDVKFVPLV
jgi:protein-L-isoaspartate(D-aspartate) O-methyltransferase